jgi:hypothetical protein
VREKIIKNEKSRDIGSIGPIKKKMSDTDPTKPFILHVWQIFNRQ